MRIDGNKLKYLIVFWAIIISAAGILFAIGFSPSGIISVSGEISPEEAIRVVFNRPQNTAFFEENFKINPDTPVDFVWSADKKNLSIVPLTELRGGESYSLAVNNSDIFLSASIWSGLRNLIGKKQIAKVMVATADPNNDFYLIDVPEITPQRLPVSDDANFILSKEAIDDLPDCGQTSVKCIEVNLATQRLAKWEQGDVVKEYTVSSGQPAYRTKTGNFSIISKVPVAYGGANGQRWKMPFWMGIYFVGSTENGFHELPFINGIREISDDLGRPVSHGCVRLGIGDAQELYDWAEIGTPVLIR